MDHWEDSLRYDIPLTPSGCDSFFYAFIGGIAKAEEKHRDKLNTIDKDGNVIEEGQKT